MSPTETKTEKAENERLRALNAEMLVELKSIDECIGDPHDCFFCEVDMDAVQHDDVCPIYGLKELIAKAEDREYTP